MLVSYFVISQIPTVRDRIFIPEGFAASTGGSRVQGWIEMLEWFFRHPLSWFTGIGTGNWKAVIQPEIDFNAAHNNYIHFLIEGGFGGLVLFLIAIVMALKQSYQISKYPVPEISRWGQAMFTAISFWAISALSQENFPPSSGFGSLLSFNLFLLAITAWAKQYIDERATVLNEYYYEEPEISGGEFV